MEKKEFSFVLSVIPAASLLITFDLDVQAVCQNEIVSQSAAGIWQVL